MFSNPASADVVDTPPSPEIAAQIAEARSRLLGMVGGAPSTNPRPTGPPAHIPSARRDAEPAAGRPGAVPPAASEAAMNAAAQASGHQRELTLELITNTRLTDAARSALMQELRQIVAAQAEPQGARHHRKRRSR